ncbi:MAG: alpha/beta fold hydrolase [Opitutaceae bacterium]
MPKSFIILILLTGVVYLVVLAGTALNQRRMIYLPSHHEPESDLEPWVLGDVTIGYGRLAADPAVVWLFLHGNAGQASGRAYAMSRFMPDDSVYVVEYPGYGRRPGKPTKESLDRAAEEAYRELRRRYPGVPVCVVGESLGSGPAAVLGALTDPPDKIILLVPFDELANVAGERMPFLPVRWLLIDNWDNAEALRGFAGPIEIYGAAQDEIIPVGQARALAASLPRAVYHELEGTHNDWSTDERVGFRFP